MRNLIFVGGGGFFRELYGYISEDSPFLCDKKVKGILDDRALYETELPYLGSIAEYQVKDDDVFLVTIGNATARKMVFELLESKNASVVSYIHPLSFVASSSNIGRGVIACPNSIINANSEVNDNVVLNVFCSVGHDAVIGMHSVLSPFAAVNGGAILGERVFLSTRATVFPLMKVGNGCIVDSHSYVKKDVEDNHIISNRIDYVVTKNRLMR